jgi:hypothetical protein
MAIGINNRGEIYGKCSTIDTPVYNVLWRPDGSVVEIPVPFGQHQAEHEDINALGYMCGIAWGSRSFGFIRKPDGNNIVIENPLHLNYYIDPFGLNNKLDAVGTLYDNQVQLRGWIWNQTDGVSLLDDLLVGEDQGWQITSATGINDAGTICAVASLNGVERAVLLQPVPEPATVAAVALGLAAMALRRRRP